ncbi:MAG: helix-turn-helix domain-containing protein [Propionibacteriaceae bacterium]|nr:helix-turn-helix domain-containing protein [Propionibacteriaceae bacterium]
MATTVPATNRLLTTAHEASLARDVLRDLDGPDGELLVTEQSQSRPLPVELGRLLQTVLEAVAEGAEVTIATIPTELTTSVAAALLDVSRPTLMKMIREGTLPAHKVGTHTRLKSTDVLAFRNERRARERAAFAELRDMDVSD